MAAALEAGVTRLFRVGGAHAVAALAYMAPRRSRAWTRSSARETGMLAMARRTSPRTARSISTPGRRVVVVALQRTCRHGSRPISSRKRGATRMPVSSPSSRETAPLAVERAEKRCAQQSEGPRRSSSARFAPTAPRSSSAPPTRRWRSPIARAGTSRRRSRSRRSGVRSSRARLSSGAFSGPPRRPGDYITRGSNRHADVGRGTRQRGGLSAADFVRVMTVQRVTRAGLARLAPTIIALADAEVCARQVDRRARSGGSSACEMPGEG